MQAGNPGSHGAAKPRAGGLRPRDASMPVVSQPAAGAEAQPTVGRSMSQLLAARSEAAAGSSRPATEIMRAAPKLVTLPDIDTADAADPLNACDFVADIFSYYKRVEPQMRVAPDYMTRQVRDEFGAMLIDSCSDFEGHCLLPADGKARRPIDLYVCLFSAYVDPAASRHMPTRGLFIHQRLCLILSPCALPCCVCRPTSMTRCAASWSTGWWTCTSSSRWEEGELACV